MPRTNVFDITRQIDRFNRRHNVRISDQFLALAEEQGELAEAILHASGRKVAPKEDIDDGNIAGEIGDIIFVAISIALLYDIDWYEALERTTKENLQK